MLNRNLLRLAIASLPLMAVAAPVQAQEAGDKIANSYICVFKPNTVARGDVMAEANRSAKAQGGLVGQVYRVALQGFSVQMPAQAVERMKAANPRIAY